MYTYLSHILKSLNSQNNNRDSQTPKILTYSSHIGKSVEAQEKQPLPQQSQETMSQCNAIDKLRYKIQNALQKDYKKYRFLPCDQQAVLVTSKIVADVFQQVGLSDRNGLAKFVLTEAPKLFLLLVWESKNTTKPISLLQDLMQNNITDNRIPIEFEFNRKDRRWYWFSIERSQKDKQLFIGDWDDMNRVSLTQNQWQFFAPVFTGNPFRFNFDPRRILPYLEYEMNPGSSGFFGEVSRAVVHGAHIPQLRPVSRPPSSCVNTF